VEVLRQYLNGCIQHTHTIWREHRRPASKPRRVHLGRTATILDMIMRKTAALLLAITLLCSSGVFANSTTANWGAQISNGVGLADGTPLPNGSNDLILLGSFNINNSTIAANGSNESFLMSHFTTFASAVIGQGNPNGTGSASDGYWTAVNTNSASSLSIQTKEIYYWVFNATTATGASQYGIFTAPSNASWVFPDDTSTAQSDTTDLSQVPHDSSGILWGSFGTGTSRDTVSPLYNLASVTAIPEPSILALITFGSTFSLLGFLKRRR
jgi:hypothetical protein